MIKNDKELIRMIKPLGKFPMRKFVYPYEEIAGYYGAKLSFEYGSQCFYNTGTSTITIWAGARTHDFCHELGHHLQSLVGSHPKVKRAGDVLGYEFWDMVAYERQAERLAYHLHKQHFHFRHHSKFNAYKNKNHIDFLYNWYKTGGRGSIIYEGEFL